MSRSPDDTLRACFNWQPRDPTIPSTAPRSSSPAPSSARWRSVTTTRARRAARLTRRRRRR